MSTVTIHDIAKRAKLNPSTVSRALRGDPRVREKTREHILALAGEMNYVPNLSARNLADGKTWRIAFLLNSLYSDIEQEPADAANRILDEKGYTAALMLCGNSGEILLRRLDQLAQKFCDGALIIPVSEDPEIIRKLKALPCPVVFIDRWLEQTGFPAVTTDQKKAVELLFENAEKDGFDAAFVTFGRYNRVSEERLETVLELLKHSGKPFFQTGEELRKWIEKNPHSRLCVFGDSAHPPEFFGGLLEQAGRPDRLIACGFDRVKPEAAVYYDRLHICIQDFRSIGAKAVSILLDLLEGGKSSGEIHRIPPLGIRTIGRN